MPEEQQQQINNKLEELLDHYKKEEEKQLQEQKLKDEQNAKKEEQELQDQKLREERQTKQTEQTDKELKTLDNLHKSVTAFNTNIENSDFTTLTTTVQELKTEVQDIKQINLDSAWVIFTAIVFGFGIKAFWDSLTRK